jgi:hypothetical protein
VALGVPLVADRDDVIADGAAEFQLGRHGKPSASKFLPAIMTVS